MAAMVAAIVMAYRGYAALSQRFAGLQLLYDFTQMVNGSERPDEVLEAILSKARELLRAERAGIHVPGDADSPARELWVHADEQGVREAVSPLPLAIAEQLISGGVTVVAPRDSKDPLQRDMAAALEVEDCVVSPLLASGKTGLLLVAGRLTSVSTFDAQDGRLFATLANHASVALENGRLIERLQDESRRREHDALHDTLTGLPNRSLLQRRLVQALRERQESKRRLAVALIDLDQFKEVNDTLGHPVGDQLLQHVGWRLREVLDGAFTIARLGGDEFAVLVPDAGDRSKLLELGQQMQDAITVPHTVDGLSLEVGASIGFAVYPDDGRDAAVLLQRADIAMYSAKASSTDNVQLYQSDRDTHSPRRLTLASDLRRSIEDGQLLLYYQPKARLTDGTIVGAEALVRWQHPDLGFVPPDEFVPLVERTGLIQPFTDLILTLAVDQINTWVGRGLDVEVSVNLSMRNLMDVSLPKRIADLLGTRASDPRRLTFEITESTIMSEPAIIIRVLKELSALGARLSVDDFGTGYSSLSYLQKLPVHELKIDKSFVFPLTSDPGAEAIVRSIIDLSRNLGLKVVAEGVEDQRAWDRLRRLSCDVAQGYFLSRPIPPSAFEDWLLDRRGLPAGSSAARDQPLLPAVEGLRT
jgi:diguanylate cyclase (GGDEF)-like protein